MRTGGTAKGENIAACQASWELSLKIALQRNRFPCLIIEDDIDLRPAISLDERAGGSRLAPRTHALRVPADSDCVSLANGPGLAARRLGDEQGCWLTKSTAEIREHAHSSGAMLLPDAAGCRKLLSFLTSRKYVWYIVSRHTLHAHRS